MSNIAFVFAGQGAQYPGMGLDLYNIFPKVRETFWAAEKIRPGTKDQCFYGSKEELKNTINTQPCIFTVEMAIANLLNDYGVTPSAVAGFSVGEIAALNQTGILDFNNALKYSIFRGQAMDDAAQKNSGTMAAIMKIDSKVVDALCAETKDVTPVNYNCPEQTVISGTYIGVQEIIAKSIKMGAKAKALEVSGPFHSPLMQDAFLKIEDYLSDININKPIIPIYWNITGGKIIRKTIQNNIAKQVISPVLWEKTITTMVQDGFNLFVEIGPGKVLSGLIKRIAPEVTTISVNDVPSFENCIDLLKNKGDENA